MYKLMAGISILVRYFYIPNPFADILYGPIINMAIEPLLQTITFGIVGLFYQSRTFPAWGSFLYLFFYWVHIALLQLCGRFDFTLWADIPVLIGYIALLAFLKTRRSYIM